MASEKKWQVTRGRFDDGTNLVSTGCHHRAGLSACGGCYARLTMALSLIQAESADAGRGIAEDVLSALRAEGKARS